eukprot:Blabericola_migrator_1__9770@NODE_535_length_7764_cov_129_977784_g408_i0_p3_GENE_NODE_535_length_7764_cov_129_977784_g408_i0NODE_535_length_7764_cov_129_977784_g408_i0_p3_ORF_typecomplete_len383_score65_88Thioredoxin/PF00085_20/5_5e13Thioredoxin_2/PF13098_6/0_00044OST3_OST6/PF04756_13/0_00041Thioredoxin_7/PF13899_6/0_0028Phosducin/PF02114_16/2_9e03Phosducin/PF02114_16/0_0045Thioredoxin_8/PF13905_6/1_1e04Thioredoxin_8/PF13905_6/0_017Thioredoxin_9/PF14595_6/0_099TraF/PF13728_6/0_27Redoxin/PF08534_
MIGSLRRANEDDKRRTPPLWPYRYLVGSLIFGVTVVLIWIGLTSTGGERSLTGDKTQLDNHLTAVESALKANRGRLRNRSTYLNWQGQTSEWFKRSPQGRFVFAFYDDSMPGYGAVMNVTGLDPLPKVDPIKKALEDLATKNPTKDPFAYSTVTRREYVDTFSNVLSDGFLTHEFPALLLLDVIDGYKKFLVKLPDHFDMSKIHTIQPDDFGTFVFETLLLPYQNKTLKPYLRSEHLVEEDDGSPASAIKAINSTYFHDVLMPGRAEPDFFVVFYAPWCGHCRRFHELFRPLARLVKQKTKRIGFYKMDSTKNDIDHPSISISRVPHVRFFSHGDYKNPAVFDHRAKEVTEENLKNFLLAHSSAGKTIAKSWKVGETNLDEL